MQSDSRGIDYGSQRIAQRSPELALDSSIEVRESQIDGVSAEPASLNLASQRRKYRPGGIGDCHLAFLRDDPYETRSSRQLIHRGELSIQIDFRVGLHWRRLSHSPGAEAKANLPTGDLIDLTCSPYFHKPVTLLPVGTHVPQGVIDFFAANFGIRSGEDCSRLAFSRLQQLPIAYQTRHAKAG